MALTAKTETEVGERIKAARVAAGLSQFDLARKAKLGHPSVVSLAERGVAGQSVRKRIGHALSLELGA